MQADPADARRNSQFLVKGSKGGVYRELDVQLASVWDKETLK